MKIMSSVSKIKTTGIPDVFGIVLFLSDEPFLIAILRTKRYERFIFTILWSFNSKRMEDRARPGGPAGTCRVSGDESTYAASATTHPAPIWHLTSSEVLVLSETLQTALWETPLRLDAHWDLEESQKPWVLAEEVKGAFTLYRVVFSQLNSIVQKWWLFEQQLLNKMSSTAIIE